MGQAAAAVQAAEPGIGHNSSIAGDQLKSLIERIESLEEEKTGVVNLIKDVYSEAKGNGYDARVLRKIVARRKRDAAEVSEEEAIMALYLRAIGME